MVPLPELCGSRSPVRLFEGRDRQAACEYGIRIKADRSESPIPRPLFRGRMILVETVIPALPVGLVRRRRMNSVNSKIVAFVPIRTRWRVQ